MPRSAALKLRGLRLVGPQRSYRVDFTSGDDPDAVRQLSLIAGEISTGKTTILEFLDWCLGAKEHPEHEEVVANVRSAQLAIDVPRIDEDGEVSPDQRDRYVIERPLGPSSSRSFLYTGDLDSMSGSPVRSFVSDPADNNSLSQYLLQLCGLHGVRLDQSPTQVDSKTSVLSFRDVQPLWFLTNRRMDNGDLAFEHNVHRSIKLVQVVNLLFGVTDSEDSALTRVVEELSAEERELRRVVETLREFLDDAGVTSIEDVDEQTDRARVEITDLSTQLRGIDARLTARTDFAAELRVGFSRAQEAAQRLQAELRDRDTLGRRLEPLRAQYADEIRRLDLVAESVTLFNSLTVVACPACQTPLSQPPSIDGHTCSLCNSELEHDPLESVTGDVGAAWPDLSSERRSLTRRLNQLKKFTQEVRREADGLRERLETARETVVRAQADLDAAASDVVAPFLAERDILARKIGDLRGAVRGLERSKQMLLQLRQKETELLRISASLKAAKGRRAEYLKSATERDGVLARIGSRLEAILEDFAYPKVSLVRVDRNLVPHVRGRSYDRVGSSGAMTLVALAWQLALFELAFEGGVGHPGFLLIDSPQKNLKPQTAAMNASEATGAENAELLNDILLNRRSIVENIYRHIDAWLRAHPGAQIVMVDNQPPATAMQHEVVRYSQDPAQPPYGLIDNEDGTTTAGSSGTAQTS